MSMVVQHNIEAIDAYNATRKNVSGVKKASEKLASGQRINRAGDDAAGLAISQKVGSQITGLNQAVRNSQDGINMIAVYEGAAAESQEVLIRMKELAMQAANGTYDDNIDRQALEHEFMHMNDELNQLSDTDFNGIVALNGGVMADGSTAMPRENGDSMFYFENWWEKIKYQMPVDLGARYDVSFTPPTCDESEYQKGTYYDAAQAGAGKLWAMAKQECPAAIHDDAQAKTSEMTIIYKVEETDKDGLPLSWQGYYMEEGKTDENGNPGVVKYGGRITADPTGSFIDELTNLKMGIDLIHGKTGDFVAVKYTKPYPDPHPPTSASGTVDFQTINGSSVLTDNYKNGVKFEIGGGDKSITNPNNWTKEIYEIVNRLDGAEFTITFPPNGNVNNMRLGGADIQFSLTDKNGDVIMNDDTTLFDPSFLGGHKPFEKDNWYIGGIDYDTDLLTKIGISYKGENGNDILIGVVHQPHDRIIGSKPADPRGTDKVTIKFSFGPYVGFDNDNVPTAAVTNIDPMFAPVSIPNYYEHSNTHMTYTDNLVLQAGARTKDAVNFTFSYTKGEDKILGDLKSNIDISAREGGLNTENLTLLNQADANKAVDGVDAALNKISMIRATFGAMQNRLDHKISNMTGTNENLTASRSYIQDTDMASEAIGFTKFNLLQQAAQSILSQANQSPQSLLQLIGAGGSAQ